MDGGFLDKYHGGYSPANCSQLGLCGSSGHSSFLQLNFCSFRVSNEACGDVAGAWMERIPRMRGHLGRLGVAVTARIVPPKKKEKFEIYNVQLIGVKWLFYDEFCLVAVANPDHVYAWSKRIGQGDR